MQSGTDVRAEGPVDHMGAAGEALSRGDHAEALVSLRKALEQDGSNVTARRQTAHVCGHLGDRAAAIEAFRELLKSVPGDAEALISIAVHLSGMGRNKEALESLAQLLAIQPGHINARLTKGQIEAHIGSLEEAARTFQAVLDVEPENLLAWRSYVNVAPSAADPERSLRMYRRLIRNNPGEISYWREIGRSLADQQRTSDGAGVSHVVGPAKSKQGGKRRLPLYRQLSTETTTQADRLLNKAPAGGGFFSSAVIRNLELENERLSMLVSQQRDRLGYLDSHATSLNYGHTSFFLRNMALFVEKFGNQTAYPSAPREIPESLLAGFSMNGQVPIEYGYLNGRYPDAFIDLVTDDDIERAVLLCPRKMRSGNGPLSWAARRPPWLNKFVATSDNLPLDMLAIRGYSAHDAAAGEFIALLTKNSIRGEKVAVYNSRNVFYEAVCCWAEAVPTAIRSRPLVNRSTGMAFQTVAEWEAKRERYDCGIAVNIAQEGLGAFGESLDPDADVSAMRRMKSMVKQGGRLFLVVPLGEDRVQFNIGRVYGDRRLPTLLDGWRLIARRDPSQVALHGDGKTRSLLVLENV